VSSNLLHLNCLSNHWTSYAKGAAEASRQADREIWRVARSIFVSEDGKIARSYGGDDPKSPYRFYVRQLLMKLGKFKRLGGLKGRPDMPDDQVTVDYAVENLVIRGTVNEVVDRILEMRETIGDFGTLLYCGKDWTDISLGRKSMELMAEKVMPAVNAAIGLRAPKASSGLIG
jgi:alkanesulfonate monooxygenase SsuD/methylene tetrahydromethanopterin reductase-like flavin-dependent oxidoreductase (luciferase family)